MFFWLIPDGWREGFIINIKFIIIFAERKRKKKKKVLFELCK